MIAQTHLQSDRKMNIADVRATTVLGVQLDRDKLARYAELYRELGGCPYDRDPGRPGWFAVNPESNWADPHGRQTTWRRTLASERRRRRQNDDIATVEAAGPD